MNVVTGDSNKLFFIFLFFKRQKDLKNNFSDVLKNNVPKYRVNKCLSRPTKYAERKWKIKTFKLIKSYVCCFVWEHPSPKRSNFESRLNLWKQFLINALITLYFAERFCLQDYLELCIFVILTSELRVFGRSVYAIQVGCGTVNALNRCINLICLH